MHPEISFLLPTIRDYNGWAKLVVDSIYSANPNFPIEILISSKEEITDPRVVWYAEPEELGSTKVVNMLYSKSTGKYVHCACDDMIYQRQWPEVMKELEFLQWRNHKYIALAGFCNQTCYLCAWHSPLFSRERCNPSYISARFPIIARSTVDTYLDGIIFNESFKHHYVDMWLGHWAAENGCQIQESQFLKVDVLRHATNFSFDQYDERIFMELCDRLKTNPGLSYSEIV